MGTTTFLFWIVEGRRDIVEFLLYINKYIFFKLKTESLAIPQTKSVTCNGYVIKPTNNSEFISKKTNQPTNLSSSINNGDATTPNQTEIRKRTQQPTLLKSNNNMNL